MTKKEFSDKMAAECGLSKVDAMRAYDAFLSVSEDYLKKGEKVSFIGFGTLSVQDKPARMARNPRTGKSIKVAAKKVVRFKVGKRLSEVVAASKKKK